MGRERRPREASSLGIAQVKGTAAEALVAVTLHNLRNDRHPLMAQLQGIARHASRENWPRDVDDMGEPHPSVERLDRLVLSVPRGGEERCGRAPTGGRGARS